MNIKTTEASLAKYHILHLVVGFLFAVILILIPRVVDVVVCVMLLSLALPSQTFPEFVDKKWLGGIAIVVGSLAAYGVLRLLHFVKW